MRLGRRNVLRERGFLRLTKISEALRPSRIATGACCLYRTGKESFPKDLHSGNSRDLIMLNFQFFFLILSYPT